MCHRSGRHEALAPQTADLARRDGPEAKRLPIAIKRAYTLASGDCQVTRLGESRQSDYRRSGSPAPQRAPVQRAEGRHKAVRPAGDNLDPAVGAGGAEASRGRGAMLDAPQPAPFRRAQHPQTGLGGGQHEPAVGFTFRQQLKRDGIARDKRDDLAQPAEHWLACAAERDKFSAGRNSRLPFIDCYTMTPAVADPNIPARPIRAWNR